MTSNSSTDESTVDTEVNEHLIRFLRRFRPGDALAWETEQKGQGLTDHTTEVVAVRASAGGVEVDVRGPGNPKRGRYRLRVRDDRVVVYRVTDDGGEDSLGPVTTLEHRPESALDAHTRDEA